MSIAKTKEQIAAITLDETPCPCGRETRYFLNRGGQMVQSCNKYQRCLTYNELANANDEWRSRACRAEHDLETLRKILAPGHTELLGEARRALLSLENFKR